MAVAIQMPKQGNTVEECLLVEWRIREGDAVAQGDIICGIETDKSTFEIESTASGVVLKLLWNEGDLVPVLADIALVGEHGEEIPTVFDTTTEVAVAEDPTDETVDEGMIAEEVGVVFQEEPGKPVSPRARKLAEKLGADPESVQGSGPGGRIIARDVQAAVDSGEAVRLSPLARRIAEETGRTPLAATGIGGIAVARDLQKPGGTASVATASKTGEVPYRGIRKLIGDRMRASLASTAQLTFTTSADASGLVRLRKICKDTGRAGITINDILCWLTVQTLPSFPEFNALFDPEAGITLCSEVHLAFAVDTPRGLMVPVVRNAHSMSLADLSRQTAGLAESCRGGSINPDFLAGGTFTVSNLGGVGVETFTPILNPPQVAILGVCAIRETPVKGRDGALAFQPRIGLSLTIDHQALDGAPAGRFLQALAGAIENIHDTLVLRGIGAFLPLE